MGSLLNDLQCAAQLLNMLDKPRRESRIVVLGNKGQRRLRRVLILGIFDNIYRIGLWHHTSS